MDRQDLQDDRRTDLHFEEITEKIIGCAIAPEHQAQTIDYLRRPESRSAYCSILAIRN